MLFHATLPDRAPWWFAPGGGVEPGESDVDAVVRELQEEIRLIVDPASLPQPVWTRDHIFRWKDVDERHLERFFLIRVDEHVVDTSGLDSEEAGVVREYRWWTPAELLATAERFSPVHLPRLLMPLLEGRLPAEPIPIGD